MPLPYEEAIVFPQPWDVVFDAAERCCDGRKRILLSSDRNVGRLVVHVRTNLSLAGASLVVDVGSAPEGSILRVGAVSASVIDFAPLLRYHVRKYLKAIEETARHQREADAGR